MNENGPAKQQIFIVNETTLWWKKIPSRAVTAREKSMPDFKAWKDQLILSLAANSAGDFHQNQFWFSILKFLVPLRIMLNLTLLVVYKWNNKT